MPTPPTVQSLIAKRVEAPLHHLIVPDADLRRTLHLTEVDLWSIQCDIEEQILGHEIPDRIVSRWQTVADAIASVRERVGVEG